jgi:septum site-determining protein MinC
MSTDSSIVANQRPAIEFKSSTFAVPALIVNNADLREINHKITQKIQQAPEFFKNSPLLLDIQAVSAQKPEVNLAALIKLLREKAFVPIALRGGSPEQNEIALKAGLFIQSLQTTFDADKSVPSATTEAATALPPSDDPSVAAALHSPIRADRRVHKKNAANTKIITTPIRSGQRVYSEGDLIIMAQVSAGAEIMAEGNIHVYGSLRGRALAGVLGKPDSRIFCFDCQAELLAIAGNYKVNDDLDQSMRHKPVQIYLQEQALIIKEL